MVVVAQLVRAPDCGSGGRRFETALPPSQNKGISVKLTLFLLSIGYNIGYNTSLLFTQFIPQLVIS